jgi:hypothetical protein
MDKVEVLEKLRSWAKELQLKPEELENHVQISMFRETSWRTVQEPSVRNKTSKSKSHTNHSKLHCLTSHISQIPAANIIKLSQHHSDCCAAETGKNFF